METIKNYLENMFAAFPKTPELLNLKRDLGIGMEDKYNELKAMGKSENESIGIVISEFGNIEELVEELNIPSITSSLISNHSHIVTGDEAATFLDDKKKYGRLTAIGVFLCIIASGIFLFLSTLFSDIEFSTDALISLSFIPFFLLLSIAVVLFIYSRAKLEKYKYLEQPFVLDYGIETDIRNQREQFRPKRALGISCGVVLCMLAFLTLVILAGTITSEPLQGLSVCITLFIVAIATFVFISVDNIAQPLDQLLTENDHCKTNNANQKLTSIVASIVWPLAAAIYLLWSFLTNDWGITWVVWPITGILFGSFSAVCAIIFKK